MNTKEGVMFVVYLLLNTQKSTGGNDESSFKSEANADDSPSEAAAATSETDCAGPTED
ncbi:hypothetical protein ACFQL7_25175 [Halocatena marina]|uniref:Uncharacterized protein n=1 Tax=Halocatena marina TaxID=2934937 RepID=A0ABD5YU67_9EURY|nr:hypothetical protein [Halocatena marina]